MSRRVPAIAVAVLLACAALGRAAAADHRLVTMVQLHSETQIAGTPSAVWTYITSGKNFATWCPEWRTTKNSKMNITRVGDVLEYIDAWGNGGRSVVTYAVQTRELRVAHEPLKGDYVCQAKFLLTRSAGGTKLEFWDAYTDSSSETDREATAQKMQLAADSSLIAVKHGVEFPVPPAVNGSSGAPGSAASAPAGTKPATTPKPPTPSGKPQR